MRLLLGIALASVLLASCEAMAPTPNLEGARETVSALAAAFSACDMSKVASLYSESAEFLAPDTPKPVVGRKAVATHLSGACASTYKPVMKVLEQRVHPLGREGAVISGSYSIGRTDKPNEAPWSASFVITLVRANGGWLIQSQATFPGP
jgi:uncharacterized protein (TIGR02246 family)